MSCVTVDWTCLRCGAKPSIEHVDSKPMVVQPDDDHIDISVRLTDEAWLLVHRLSSATSWHDCADGGRGRQVFAGWRVDNDG